MTHRTPRIAGAALMLALVLTGCSLSSLPTTGSKPGASATPAAPGTTVHNEPLEPLNGLEFKPLTEANMRFLSNNGSQIVSQGAGNALASGAKAAAPTAAAAPAADSAVSSNGAALATTTGTTASSGGGSTGSANEPGGAYSGNVYAYYGYQYYFGGFGSDSQMSLVSLQQAQTSGATGGFAQIIGGVAAPIVKSWAADARLISSNASLTNDGGLAPTPSPNPDATTDGTGGLNDFGNSGWTFTYASSSRNEVLAFSVTPAKTTILRLRWEPLALQPARVLTDSGAAVKALVAAIKDKTFQGEEEKSGKDYFLGFPFTQMKTGQYDGDYQRTSVVYDVPSDATWSASLEEVMGRMVWNLTFYEGYYGGGVVYANGGGVAVPVAAMAEDAAVKSAVQTPCPGPTTTWEPGWNNNSASGMVDAETGAVIRFTRPTKSEYRNTVVPDCAVPGPSLEPKETPTPTPSTTPSVAPSPTPTPVGL